MLYLLCCVINVIMYNFFSVKVADNEENEDTDDGSNIYPCVIQYVAFPPHTTMTKGRSVFVCVVCVRIFFFNSVSPGQVDWNALAQQIFSLAQQIFT